MLTHISGGHINAIDDLFHISIEFQFHKILEPCFNCSSDAGYRHLLLVIDRAVQFVSSVRHVSLL